MSSTIRAELLERYHQTGKIGFTRPKDEAEAYSLIESLTSLLEEEPKEIVLTIPEIAQKMKEFFENF